MTTIEEATEEAFAAASFYDCFDSEQLTHETPIAALLASLAASQEFRETPRECIKRVGAIKVWSYARMSLEPEWAGRAAELVVDDIVERFEDDYGDFDRGCQKPFTPKDLEVFIAEMTEVVGRFAAKGKVYQSEKNSYKIYEEDEILSLIRTYDRALLDDAVNLQVFVLHNE